MIPLLVIALAFSAAVLVYEASPRARARLDDYVQALRAAHTAHREADTRLAAARTSPDSIAAAQHARAAAVANRNAAQKTFAAAKTAKTEMQRAAVSQSAAAIAMRDDDITDTATDAYLSAAGVEADPIVAVQHVHEAAEVNRSSAQKAAEVAKAAQTEKERAAAAQSAAKVVEREHKITAALAKLGVGQCDVRVFTNVTSQIRDVLLAKLRDDGMTVKGDNPWDIETHQYDVTLRAVWDPKTQTLKLIVTSGKGGYFGLVTCAEIWKKIDPVLKEVVGP